MLQQVVLPSLCSLYLLDPLFRQQILLKCLNCFFTQIPYEFTQIGKLPGLSIRQSYTDQPSDSSSLDINFENKLEPPKRKQ